MLRDGTFIMSELKSATIPFTLDGITHYFQLLYLMAVFHVSTGDHFLKQHVLYLLHLDLFLSMK